MNDSRLKTREVFGWGRKRLMVIQMTRPLHWTRVSTWFNTAVVSVMVILFHKAYVTLITSCNQYISIRVKSVEMSPLSSTSGMIRGNTTRNYFHGFRVWVATAFGLPRNEYKAFRNPRKASPTRKKGRLYLGWFSALPFCTCLSWNGMKNQDSPRDPRWKESPSLFVAWKGKTVDGSDKGYVVFCNLLCAAGMAFSNSYHGFDGLPQTWRASSVITLCIHVVPDFGSPLELNEMPLPSCPHSPVLSGDKVGVAQHFDMSNVVRRVLGRNDGRSCNTS